MTRNQRQQIEELIKNSGLKIELEIKGFNYFWLLQNRGCFSENKVKKLILNNLFEWVFKRNLPSFVLNSNLEQRHKNWFFKYIFKKNADYSSELNLIIVQTDSIMNTGCTFMASDNYPDLEYADFFIIKCLIKYCIKIKRRF